VSTGAILYGHGTPTHGGISKRFESSHHFVHVSIVGPHIDAKVVRDDGTVIETFALERGHRYDRPNKSDSADDGIGTGESAGCSVSSRPGHGAGTQWLLAITMILGITTRSRIRSRRAIGRDARIASTVRGAGTG
jgi:hypothetical protein